MQDKVLERRKDEPLLVYAIWFAMIEGDERNAFMPELLHDPRVVHLWDEEKVIGRWFAENMKQEGCDDETLWDAFFVFGAGARWDDKPGPLACCGYPIWGERNSLRDAVAELVHRQ